MTRRVEIPAVPDAMMPPQFAHTVLHHHDQDVADVDVVLHLYGSKADRLEAETIARLRIQTPHRIQHHWRPWTAAVLDDTRPLIRVPMTRRELWIHILTIAGALAFIGGLVAGVALHNH